MSNNAILGQYATKDTLATRRGLYEYATGPSLTDVILEKLHGFDGMRFLDVGCGYGADIATFLEKYPSMHAVGIDQSAGMIDEAKAKAPSATFLAADAQAFTLEGKFDRILARHVLHLVADPKKAIENILQHLVPGGRAIFVLHSLKSVPHSTAWMQWFSEQTGIGHTSSHDLFNVETHAALFEGDDRKVTVETTTSMIELTDPEPYIATLETQKKRWNREATAEESATFFDRVRTDISAEIATNGHFAEPSVNGIVIVDKLA